MDVDFITPPLDGIILPGPNMHIYVGARWGA